MRSDENRFVSFVTSWFKSAAIEPAMVPNITPIVWPHCQTREGGVIGSTR